MNMSLGNILVKKKAIHLVTEKYGPSKTRGDCCLVRRNKRKFLKNIKGYQVKLHPV